jgi:uncharacterized protein YndB with AHSA1/START domain
VADILQDFPIKATPDRVFRAVSDPASIDEWWTQRCSGQPAVGATYDLDFGPEYLWRAVVTKSVADTAFELRLTEADADWIGSVVGFELMPSASGTQVRFYHRGWREPNEHYRISSHCWAMYLRILRRHLEHGESVPYDRRLDV